MVAVTLLKCDPDEFKLLFDVLEDIKGSSEDAPRLTKMAEMNTIKNVLERALESYQWSDDDEVTHGAQNPSGSECDAGEVKHKIDGLGEEPWEFERLCRWYGQTLHNISTCMFVVTHEQSVQDPKPVTSEWS